jgi:hypothetical protein
MHDREMENGGKRSKRDRSERDSREKVIER